jgi:hypothetical protein
MVDMIPCSSIPDGVSSMFTQRANCCDDVTVYNSTRRTGRLLLCVDRRGRRGLAWRVQPLSVSH